MPGIRADLEAKTLAPEAAVERLREGARAAPTRAARIDAYRVLGDIMERSRT